MSELKEGLILYKIDRKGELLKYKIGVISEDKIWCTASVTINNITQYLTSKIPTVSIIIGVTFFLTKIEAVKSYNRSLDEEIECERNELEVTIKHLESKKIPLNKYIDKTETSILRDKFKSLGYSYETISPTDISLLRTLLTVELSQFSDFPMKLLKERKKDFRYNSKGSIIEGYFYVSGGYFDRREAISFNNDGFIGFAGWASSHNLVPFIKAFDIWISAI